MTTAGDAPAIPELRSPRDVESAGVRLANEIRGAVGEQVDVVVAWQQDVGDLILAHVVARELDATRAAVSLDEGLVQLTGALAPGSRVALVSRAFTREYSMRAAATVVTTSGGSLIAIACLVPTAVFDAELPAGVAGVVAAATGDS